MKNISKYVTWKEAIKSNTAIRKGISNIPTSGQLVKMKLVASKVFDKVRVHFNVPIHVSSMFRSTALNKAIGGAHKYKLGKYIATSQHCKGEAMDIDADTYGKVTNEDIFLYIFNNLDYDQLILEGVEDGKASWVHVSYKSSGNRKQALIMYRAKGKAKYLPYSKDNYNKFIK
jgi:hypothetical protein